MSNQRSGGLMARAVKWVAVGLAGAFGVVGVASVLAASVKPSPAAPGPIRSTLAAKVIETFSDATTAIVSRLRDPDSARFSDLRVSHVVGDKGSSVTAVCGLYNSKNGLGGYGGFAPFYYVREVVDKRGFEERYQHHFVGELSFVDSGDAALIQQMNETAYNKLCGDGTGLSEDEVLFVPPALYNKQTGFFEKQDAMWADIKVADAKRDREINAEMQREEQETAAANSTDSSSQ